MISFNNYEYKEIYREGSCFLSPEQDYSFFSIDCSKNFIDTENVLIWGDSHAAALSFGLRNMFSNTIQFTASGCPPILDTDINFRPLCKKINDYIALKITQIKPKKIFLHANWNLYENYNTIMNLQNTINFIKSKSPHSTITIIGGVPQYKPSLPTLMFHNNTNLEINKFEKSISIEKLMHIDQNLNSLAKINSINFISAIHSFCENNLCLVTAKYKEETMPVAWDYGHLTAAGSMFLASQIKSLLKN